LVNITYYWWNTICNSIGKLAVIVTFVVIIFQLFGIYR
jgi:hypothetical protein